MSAGMVDDKSTDGSDDEAAPDHHKGLGEKLQRAEHAVEASFKDTVARVENRMILAGEAETSGSPEVNFASALEVAINPPHADDSDEGDHKATDQAEAQVASDGDLVAGDDNLLERPADQAASGANEQPA
ncbi:MAG: hypothetical protein M3O87_05755, partial [Candidatus Dormibacteraeota bacterium]|nr:hypothetical protein [Candidatus Dormibacteraeota bacterium]